MYTIDGKKKFATLAELIEYYYEGKIKLHVPLLSDGEQDDQQKGSRGSVESCVPLVSDGEQDNRQKGTQGSVESCVPLVSDGEQDYIQIVSAARMDVLKRCE